jgi:hypothetical protein
LDTAAPSSSLSARPRPNCRATAKRHARAAWRWSRPIKVSDAASRGTLLHILNLVSVILCYQHVVLVDLARLTIATDIAKDDAKQSSSLFGPIAFGVYRD